MLNIAVLVSGGGTNLQALIDAGERGELQNGRICCVISGNPQAYALERAKRHGIKTAVVARKSFASSKEFDLALLKELESCKADLIILAGFMSILGGELISKYENKIINVHPSLIPAFCGRGFYGLKVHQAVLDYGAKVTGATVHFVNSIPDGGAIILQKAVAVESGDTPETLQKRVMEQAEWQLLPKAVSLFCQGRLKIEGREVYLK
ncbi:MAG: phosphoribosylglycinamide formyltransferase [Oscillospiraceae bacterium]|jgi:phosphoribosylglycinamide formyltransferase-1|nr:phosphoribosylglycinamide formyltransferase [Oscillospiraceae bacterium]